MQQTYTLARLELHFHVPGILSPFRQGYRYFDFTGHVLFDQLKIIAIARKWPAVESNHQTIQAMFPAASNGVAARLSVQLKKNPQKLASPYEQGITLL
jgi:hypothetical protein